jgi:hypothetical protein
MSSVWDYVGSVPLFGGDIQKKVTPYTHICELLHELPYSDDPYATKLAQTLQGKIVKDISFSGITLNEEFEAKLNKGLEKPSTRDRIVAIARAKDHAAMDALAAAVGNDPANLEDAVSKIHLASDPAPATSSEASTKVAASTSPKGRTPATTPSAAADNPAPASTSPDNTDTGTTASTAPDTSSDSGGDSKPSTAAKTGSPIMEMLSGTLEKFGPILLVAVVALVAANFLGGEGGGLSTIFNLFSKGVGNAPALGNRAPAPS